MATLRSIVAGRVYPEFMVEAKAPASTIVQSLIENLIFRNRQKAGGVQIIKPVYLTDFLSQSAQSLVASRSSTAKQAPSSDLRGRKMAFYVSYIRERHSPPKQAPHPNS